MISFQLLGKKGRLGNALFQVASTLGLAKKHDTEAIFNHWDGFNSFTGPFNKKEIQPKDLFIEIKEKHYHHHDWEITTDTNLTGWLQSYKYWQDNGNEIRDALTFKPALIDNLKSRYGDLFEKPVICISIRRGDFVGNSNYYQLPITYYILALFEHFPDWKEKNILFLSDDFPYCRVHFESMPNAFFADDLNAIEQLCLGTMCNDFIISNSTFSWWVAYLANRGKVIRPLKNMDGELARRSDEKDYWPEQWQIFEHEGKKISANDTTFTIPVFCDHSDRKQNLDLCVCMVQRDFDTKIIIGEQGTKAFGYFEQWCKYIHFEGMELFHRTKMLNDMAMMADTPFIVNYDCDTFLPPMQIWFMIDALRNGQDMAYPFDGRSARVPREQWFARLEKSLDVGIVGNTEFKGKAGMPLPTSSVGHAMAFNKESFIEGGMENEKMISFGPEDCERWYRFRTLGYKVHRVVGAVYHMDHWIGPNSSKRNPFFNDNHKENDKINAMDADALRQYVNTWTWVHKYTEGYYRRISESAVQSAGIIYKEMERLGYKFEKILDVGCGIGEWNYKNYFGIDYKAPVKSLLIPKENYYDFDLTSDDPFPELSGFDLVICLEVLEHLPEEFAEKVIGRLCGAGSDTVLFSAAIPYQSGVGHVNERWQTYWADMFSRFGFYPVEKQLRESIKDNSEIDLWYRQNIVIYERGGKGTIDDYVHPVMYMNIAGQKNIV